MWPLESGWSGADDHTRDDHRFAPDGLKAVKERGLWRRARAVLAGM